MTTTTSEVLFDVTRDAQEILVEKSAFYDTLPPEQQSAVDELQDLLASDSGITGDEVAELDDVLAILQGETDGELTAVVGDTITLTGNDPALEVRVTLLRVVDPARSSNEFLQPEPGNRYVAVRLALANSGTVVYDDSPSNGASLIDTRDQEYDGGIFDVVEPALGTLRIRPGDRRVGFITFELPRRARLRTFQFALDSGFAPESGEWTLAGAS